MKEWIKCQDKLPPDIPEDNDFGVEYEIKYISESGEVKTAITEWLWEREWNWILPVIAWREYIPVVDFGEYKNRICK